MRKTRKRVRRLTESQLRTEHVAAYDKLVAILQGLAK